MFFRVSKTNLVFLLGFVTFNFASNGEHKSYAGSAEQDVPSYQYFIDNSETLNLVHNIDGRNFISSGEDDEEGDDPISAFKPSVKANFGKGNHKNGLETKFSSINVGFFSDLNDQFSMGIFCDFAKEDRKYKLTRTGDKEKINSSAPLLHLQYKITPNFWTRLKSFYTLTNIDGERKVLNNLLAKKKAKNNTFSTELSAGYDFNLNNTKIVPMLGLEYSHQKIGAYKEKGSSIENREKKASSKNNFFVKLGTLISLNNILNRDEFKLKPFLLGEVKFRLNSSEYVTESKFVSQKNYSKKIFNAHSVEYKGGIGLSILYKILELNTEYQYFGFKNYSSHSGSVNIKLFF